VHRGVELSIEAVQSWYEKRACEIEELSGQVDGALQLVKLAIDKSVEVCYGYVVMFRGTCTIAVNGTVLWCRDTLQLVSVSFGLTVYP